MEFFRQEYWSGLPFLFPGYLPYPEMEPEFSALAGGFFITELPILQLKEKKKLKKNKAGQRRKFEVKG